MIIAIDGPAASGKGTLARRLAEHYGLPHLDTGLLYRAVARALIDSRTPFDDAAAATAAARGLKLTAFDVVRLKEKGVGDAASQVAAIPSVREALLKLQKDFVQQPGGAVLDGRDTGTVIAPDADVKIFIEASAEVRAERRFRELTGKGENARYEDVLANIKGRDARDSGRSVAPLIPAKDAVLLDTTHLDIEAAFRAALSIVEAARAGRERR
ncbi:MAG TPA: (d)CMP kinase [Xanthobacteraceae bacterium]|jgi:cytidylate kinase|nr:(d)CMP kinase [Xanthobacteraceae bacterium]